MKKNRASSRSVRMTATTTTASETTATLTEMRKPKPVAKVPCPLISQNSIEVLATAAELKKTISILPPVNAKRDVAEDKRDASEDKRDAPEDNTTVETSMPPGKAFPHEGQEMPLGLCPYEDLDDLKNFDLMNINITIYGITGILCEEKTKKKAKRKSSLNVKAAKSKESTVKSSDDEEADGKFVIPTTVAASVQRNAISSQTVIETFYPSQPMKIESTPGVATNLSAMWQSPSAALLGGEPSQYYDEEEDSTSFQLLRMMMKKPYVRGQMLVENYVHEHVQIGVNLCRGGELMRLGVATLIITGEEEGQVMMHVPCQSLANPGVQSVKPSRSKKGKNKESKKKKKTCFKNDNKYFRLDENASLYVGVQVNPQRDVEAAARYEDNIEASDSQLLRAAHAAKAALLELRQQREKKEEQQKLSEKQTVSQESSKSEGNDSKTKNEKSVSTKTKKSSTSSKEALSQNAVVLKSYNPENVLSSMFCGAWAGATTTATNNQAQASKSVATQGHSEAETKSKDLVEEEEEEDFIEVVEKPSMPMSEILNVKYAPAYAKSFFSAVTYSYTNTEVTDITDQELSDVVETSAKMRTS